MRPLQICKVVKVGRSGLYVLLPREAREKLQIKRGDELVAFITDDGGLLYEKPEKVTLIKG